MSQKTKSAYKFFLEHAGFSYQPLTETPLQGRRRCARQLAKAERVASAIGISFRWEIDQFCTSDDFSDEEPAYAQYSCVCLDASGEAIGALGGIDFGRDVSPWGHPYRRVVEAELALEAI